MGKRGPLPKPSGRAQGHRKPAEGLALVPSPGDRDVPPLHRGALTATRKAWKAYWHSDVSRAAADTDMQALRRLFKLYDQYERSARVVDRALVVKGSMGQMRVNPLADHMLKLETHIIRLENELGLTPAARARLNIDFSTAIKSLEEINREADVDYDYDAEDDDPRAALQLAADDE